MITSWQLYWLTRLDYIKHLVNEISILISVAVIVLFVFGFINYFGDNDDIIQGKKFVKTSLFLIPFDLIFLILFTFIPSTKETAAIIVLPKIINNQKVQQIPDKVLDLANSWLEELKPKDKK